MKNIKTSNEYKMSATEEVIRDSIDSIRKRIIHLQFECEFSKRIMEGISDKDSELAKQVKESINNVEMEINHLIVKLNFYKEKREDLKTKKAMKSLKKYPETINMSKLKEIE